MGRSKKYNGKINAGAKTLELGGHEVLLIKEEHISLTPKYYQIIEANFYNDVKVGWVPLSDIEPDLSDDKKRVLFENFITEQFD